MMFSVLPLIALMAMPGFAKNLANPLKIIIATDWDDGWVADTLIHSIAQSHDKVRIDFPGETPAQRDLLELKTFELDHIDDSFHFRMERGSRWSVGDYINCTVSVVEDPGVTVVHVVILDDHNGTMDKEDARINVYDKQVKLVCEEKNFRDKV